ncbi:MAG: ABC transporter permease [Deltaproteobacteria bacterium]|nr:ABC transporter permease [Deltaproteobacteria bacterium]
MRNDLFPPFSTVVQETVSLTLKGILTEHFFRTLLRVIIGFSIGALVGTIVGIITGYKALLDKSLSPVISFFYPIPAIGWVPLLMLWVGITEALPILVIAIHSFFPVCYTTRSGIKSIDQRIVKVARSLGAKGKDLILRVIIPSALPHVFAGLRLSSGGSWRVVIAAEMLAIPKGLGALVMKAESLIRPDIILSCLFILALMSLFFERIFLFLEKKQFSNGISPYAH